MKNTYNYPKTLRNYQDKSSKSNQFVSPSHHKNKSLSSSAHFHKKILQQQDHNVGEYYVLTNPSQFRPKAKKQKKNKNKSKSKQSHLSLALKQKLNRPLIVNSQIGPQNILHCKSLQKLQIISNDRSEQIKNLINQKAYLIAQNQQLKAKLVNPTYRQQQYIQKIAQKQFQISNLKQTLKRKQQIIGQIQKEYKAQIQRQKVKHRQQLTNLRQQMNKLRLQKISSQTSKKYNFQPYDKNIKTQTIHKNNFIQSKPINTYQSKPINSYQSKPFSSYSTNTYNNTYSTNSYKLSQDTSSPTVITSTNYKKDNNQSNQDKLISKQKSTSNDNKGYTSYIGQDGYERRVYNSKQKQQKQSTTITKNSTQYNNSNPAIRYVSQAKTSPFTNQKITNYVSKQFQHNTNNNIYKYSDNSNKYSDNSNKYSDNLNTQTNKNNSGLYNQNLYSKSITFQCFNDSL